MFRNEVIVFAADYLIVIIALLVVFFWWRQTKALKKEIIWRAAISFPIIFIISRIMGALYYNPRPFVLLNVTPFVAHIADNGFPSDHTLLSAASAALVFSFNKKWGAVLFILAILVGVGRVAALVHHPVDILGSLAAASVAMVAVYYAERFSKQRRLQMPNKTL